MKVMMIFDQTQAGLGGKESPVFKAFISALGLSTSSIISKTT